MACRRGCLPQQRGISRARAGRQVLDTLLEHVTKVKLVA
jgi:hypothetical protein